MCFFRADNVTNCELIKTWYLSPLKSQNMFKKCFFFKMESDIISENFSCCNLFICWRTVKFPQTSLRSFLWMMVSSLQTLMQELNLISLLDKISNEKYLSWLYSKLWEEETTCEKENICHASELSEMLFVCLRKAFLEMADWLQKILGGDHGDHSCCYHILSILLWIIQ